MDRAQRHEFETFARELRPRLLRGPLGAVSARSTMRSHGGGHRGDVRHPWAVDDAADNNTVAAWPEETVPILRISDAAAALRWYERLGFEEEWTHRFTPESPAFVSIRRGSPGIGVRIFLSEHRGDAQPDGLLYLRVIDVAPVAAAFGAEVHDSGARYEVSLVDPDGNRVRVGSLTGRSEPGYTHPDSG